MCPQVGQYGPDSFYEQGVGLRHFKPVSCKHYQYLAGLTLVVAHSQRAHCNDGGRALEGLQLGTFLQGLLTPQGHSNGLLTAQEGVLDVRESRRRSIGLSLPSHLSS